MSYSHRRRTGRSLLALPLLLSLVACENVGHKVEALTPAPAVKVAEAVSRDVPIYVEAIGQTRGNTEIEIAARVEGFLETVNFKEGTFVKKGQLLYTIDPRPFQAALAQAKANVAQAQAELTRLHQDVARYEPLVAKNAVAIQDLETAQANERAQQSVLAAAQAVEERAVLELGYTRIVAPADGLIGTTEVHPGTLVGRGESTHLTHISRIDPIHVRFSISEQDYLHYARKRQDLAKVAAGQVATDTKGAPVDSKPAAGDAKPVSDAKAASGDAKPASAGGPSVEGKASGAPAPAPVAQAKEFQLLLADGSVHPYTGKLVFVDRNVDASTGTIRLEAAFPNPGGIIRPGQYARVRAAVDVKKGAVVISQGAVQELQGINNVAVVGADDSVEIRMVKPSERIGGFVVLDSGLKAGERVVVEGLQKIRPGVQVQAETVQFEGLAALDSKVPER